MKNTDSLKQIYGKRFYGFFRFVVKIYNAFVLHAKIRRNYKTDKPYLMLINHQSYYDFFYVVRLAGKDYVNFVVADKMSNTKRNRWFIKNLKAITRGQFSSDFTSIKKIKMHNFLNGLVGLIGAKQVAQLLNTTVMIIIHLVLKNYKDIIVRNKLVLMLKNMRRNDKC